MEFCIGALIGFFGIEFGSAVAHRWLFHGPLWFLHHSHHPSLKQLQKGRQLFEANDLFSVVFACIAVALAVSSDLGRSPHPFSAFIFGTSCGITFYGMLYFVVHDHLTHRRKIARWVAPLGKLLIQFQFIQKTIEMHRIHHKNKSDPEEKPGNRPFGLFIGLL